MPRRARASCCCRPQFFSSRYFLLPSTDFSRRAGNGSWRVRLRRVHRVSSAGRGVHGGENAAKIPQQSGRNVPPVFIAEKHSPTGLRKPAEHASLFLVPCVFQATRHRLHAHPTPSPERTTGIRIAPL